MGIDTARKPAQLHLMSNLATLAPKFTPENASEMGRRGAMSRKLNREREKLRLQQLEELERKSPIPDDDEARKRRVQKQIDMLLNDMEKAKDLDKRLRIGAAIERLWKLVQPTAGVLKPSAKRGRPLPSIAFTEAPQPAEPPQIVVASNPSMMSS